MIRNLFLAAALVLAALPAWAQSNVTTTTAAAAGTATQNFITVASATGITAGSTGLWLPATGEYMSVTSVSGTTIGVVRGDLGSRALAFANSATVVIAPPGATTGETLFGTCTGANARPYFQQINVPQNLMYVCLQAGTWQARQGTPVVYNTTLVITR